MFKNIDFKKTKNIFITATNTNIGKTYSCKKLILSLVSKGFKVGYFKPFESGVINNKPQDGISMLNLVKQYNKDFIDITINDVVPYQFELPASIFVAKKDINIDIDLLLEKKQYLEKFCDILIIEGAGGLMVPIEKNFFIIDIIKLFKSYCILIVPSNLGSINDNLLSQDILKKRDIKYSWIINLYKDKTTFNEITLPFYKQYFGKIEFLDDI